MARFSGFVGYVTQEETTPGVWTAKERERKMVGDIIRESSSNRTGEYLNDDISLSHRVSIVGDAYAFENYYYIKWVDIERIKWKVTSIEIKRPRIILNLGGVWNG